MSPLKIRITITITFLGVAISSIVFAKQLDCKDQYTDMIFGKTVEVCYATNYTNYTPQPVSYTHLTLPTIYSV